MKFSELTDEQIKNLSKDELLELDLIESIGKINKPNRLFKSFIRHSIGTLVLGILSMLLGYEFYSLFFFVPSAVAMVLTYIFFDKRKTAYISFKMTMLFYESSEIIDDSNIDLVNKYIETIE